MTAIHDLIDSLHGTDAEGSEVAYLLRKSVNEVTGHDWGVAGPPKWHPDHPQHPLHDAYLEDGQHMYAREAPGKYGLRSQPGAAYGHHPLTDRSAAEEHAASVRADPNVVHPANRGRIEADESLPVHPSHPHHDFYLANPKWFHEHMGHSMDGEHLPKWIEDHGPGRLMSGRGVPFGYDVHPANASHPDHDHFLAAHAAGAFDNRSFARGEHDATNPYRPWGLHHTEPGHLNPTPWKREGNQFLV